MDKPLVSILIANFNNAKYLDECIQSIINQSYKNWEVIFVDDCSTDNSIDTISKYTQIPLRIFKNEKNEGCGFSKHRCAMEAQGELLAYLDADDAINETALEDLVYQFSDKTSMVYSRFFICDENLAKISVSPNQKAIPPGSNYLDEGGFAISHLVMFKKNAYVASGGIDPKYRRAVDQDLYYKLEEVGEIKFLDKALYLYRSNPQGISKEGKRIAFIWHEIAIMEALQRRGKNPEIILNRILQRQDAIKASYENSSAYKIGSILTYLPSKIKKLFG
jgi:glycosyltransferase involved in cell wall biosynthesis